jgi:gluconolactonase
MAADAAGRLYVSTAMGIQFCDQAGRGNGIVSRLGPEALSEVAFGGPSREELVASSGGKLWRRQIKVKGVFSFEPPVTPPASRL